MNKESLIKQTAYTLMAITYYISYPLKVQDDKILLIMTHDDSSEGNIGLTKNYFQKQNPNLKLTRLARGLPLGVDLSYADQITLSAAHENRTIL